QAWPLPARPRRRPLLHRTRRDRWDHPRPRRPPGPRRRGSLDRPRDSARRHPAVAIADLLAPYGLALAVMGDIDRQSIAGAIQTGTHGTGGRSTGFAAMVRG